jgi:hypothetical protein
MTNVIPSFVITLLLQWLVGLGLLATMRAALPRSITLPTGLLLGAYVHTLIVVVLDLLGVRLTFGSVTGVLGVTAVIANAWWPRVRTWYAALINKPTFTFRLYDIAAYVIAAYLVFVAMWAAWYWPVTPFDAMAGIDLMARQSVADGTLNNSILTDPALAGRLSNQPFYAPFAMLQQVIYRLMGWPFGQVWMAVTAFCYYWVMWAMLRRAVHPFIADVLALLLIMVPEVHGYTYLLQTDFLNAVYLTVGIIILGIDIERNEARHGMLAALFFAAACWSRTETILLVGLGLISVFVPMQRALGLQGALRYAGAIAVAAFASFALWHVIYFYGVFPVHPDAASEIAGFDVEWFGLVVLNLAVDVLADIGLWGWTLPLFVLVIIASLVQRRSIGDRWTLLWIVAILVGLEIVGTLFASAVVQQTLRRGVFKLIPLMYLFMARSPILEIAGERLRRWESARAT